MKGYCICLIRSRASRDFKNIVPEFHLNEAEPGVGPKLHLNAAIYYLVAEGLANRQIVQLNLSKHTVRNYRFRSVNKLGTSSRLELGVYVNDRRQRRGISEGQEKGSWIPIDVGNKTSVPVLVQPEMGKQRSLSVMFRPSGPFGAEIRGTASWFQSVRISGCCRSSLHPSCRLPTSRTQVAAHR